MKSKIRKYFIPIGAVSILTIPVVTAISCGSSVERNKNVIDLDKAFNDAYALSNEEAQNSLKSVIDDISGGKYGVISVNGESYSLYEDDGIAELQNWLGKVSEYYPLVFPDAPANVIGLGNSLETFNSINNIDFVVPVERESFTLPSNFPAPLEHTHWEFASDQIYTDNVGGKTTSHWFKNIGLLRMPPEYFANIKIKSKLVTDPGYNISIPKDKFWESDAVYPETLSPILATSRDMKNQIEAQQVLVNSLKQTGPVNPFVHEKVENKPFTEAVARNYGIVNFVPTPGFSYNYSADGWGETDSATHITISVSYNGFTPVTAPMPIEIPITNETRQSAVSQINAEQTRINNLEFGLSNHDAAFYTQTVLNRLVGYAEQDVTLLQTQQATYGWNYFTLIYSAVKGQANQYFSYSWAVTTSQSGQPQLTVTVAGVDGTVGTVQPQPHLPTSTIDFVIPANNAAQTLTSVLNTTNMDLIHQDVSEDIVIRIIGNNKVGTCVRIPASERATITQDEVKSLVMTAINNYAEPTIFNIN